MPDDFTHIVVAYLVGKRFLSRKPLFAFFVAAVIPDLECLIGFIYALLSNESIQSAFLVSISPPFHPSVLHSLFFLPLTISLASIISKAVYRWRRQRMELRRLLRISSIAVLLHLFLDLLQTGNKPFWPLPFEAGLDILPYDVPGRAATIILAFQACLIDYLIQHAKRFTATDEN